VNEFFSCKVTFGPILGAGDYLIDVGLGCGDRGDGAPTQLIHRVARIAAVSFRHRGMRPTFFGAANLGARMEITSAHDAVRP